MERLLALAVIGAIIYGACTHSRTPTPSIRGEIPIVRDGTDFRFWNDGKSAEDQIRVRARDGAFPPLYFDVDERGVLHQSPEQARDGAVIVDYRHQLYAARAWLDVGAWAGVVATKGDDPATQIGLRVSPVRFFDGVLAADVVASEHAIGAGASAYLPRGLCASPPWNHLGFGAWYMVDFDGGDAGPAFGLTLSTR